MNITKENLRKDRVFQYFYQICQIPHKSGNEKALSDYILGWATKLGLEARQDAVNNVFIQKPATPGYEMTPAVMLQAHIDMVCEKAAGVSHDFSQDPIEWVVDGDILSTGGKTTLGADDGIGMALAMAVLESDELQHPALEVLFTVAEEEDFTGAFSFDVSNMRAAYLINLDHACDKEIVCGSCGGMQVDFKMSVKPETTPTGWKSYSLSVSGMKGGHSGEDIHRGRGNANILLARLLLAVEQCCDFRLAHIKGGTFRLAIPREAKAVICIDPANQAKLTTAISELEREMRAELTATGDALTISFTEAGPTELCAVPTAVITAMTLIPDGILQMNETLTGLVDTSANLGEVYFNGAELHMVLEIRSARESLRTYLFQRMQRLSALLGASCICSNTYPSWDFRPASPLCKLSAQIYEQLYGQEATCLTVHAGLEVGCFFCRKSDIDAISLGANCWNFHSPSEAVSISSTHKVYEFLINILASIPMSRSLLGK